MKNIPNITALRFFMALLVMLFHIPQFCDKQGIPFVAHYKTTPMFNRGSEAVWMFFALSGFLIIRQLYQEKITTHTIALKAFFMRRILRIFPLYYLILTIGLLHYQVILPALGFEFQSNYPLWNGILLAVFFMPNVFAALYQPGGILEILWSIGIEEQFYLFIAPLFLFLPTRWIRTFLLGFTLLYFMIFFSENLHWLKGFYMYFFYFSFCGLLSIVTLENKKIVASKALQIVVYCILILYFFTNLFKENLPESEYHLASLLLFSTFISILALKPITVLSHKWLIYLGKISYGLYMYHALVVQLVGFIYLKVLASLRLSNNSIIFLYYTLTIGLTVAIAHYSYQYFERYFLSLKTSYRTLKN